MSIKQGQKRKTKKERDVIVDKIITAFDLRGKIDFLEGQDIFRKQCHMHPLIYGNRINKNLTTHCRNYIHNLFFNYSF